MNTITEYILNTHWCCFKNNNRTLFERSLWIKGATEFKNEKIKNLITEDITVYYKNNQRQLRGFNGNQKPLSKETLKNLNEQSLIGFIREYEKIKKKANKIAENLIIFIEKDSFLEIKKEFKKLIQNHCRLNGYEYVISSLGQELYTSLEAQTLSIFNQWKNYDQIQVSNAYFSFFHYLSVKYSFLEKQKDFLLYVHVEEILRLLDNKIALKTIFNRIEKRKQGFVLLNIQNKKYSNKIIQDSDCIHLIQNYLEKLENESMSLFQKCNEIKGKTTFLNNRIITGKCIVLNHYDTIPTDFFNKIVVCSVTTAEDIHKYLDAKALVVDHGGIVSHAAIFSREIGKPCLMGCNVATKIFKTGDIIEIDFNREVVYKK